MSASHLPMPAAETRLQHLRWMILARATDDRLAALFRQGGQLAGGVYLGRGQEAFSAAGAMPLRRGDIFAPLIRDGAGRLAFGENLVDVFRTCLGKRTGPMRGRDGNVHRGNLDLNLLPMISHLGGMIPVVVGALMARRLKGALTGTDLPVGMASIGEGGMAAGATHEGLNAAGVERLPVVVMVANNQVAYSTFNDRSFACTNLVERAVGYGFTGHTCDGTDADACLAVMADAVARARRGEGPQMVVATLLRLSGHAEHDDAAYVTPELRSRFGDCLTLTARTLKQQGLLDDAALTRMWDEAKAQIQTAYQQAAGEDAPDPQDEDWTAYSERDLTGFRA